MKIRIRGAKENNLRNIDTEFSEGITVVTGISGSGKSSLVFDTLYHEARRRFLDIYSVRSSQMRLTPVKIDSITGAGPAIAVGQNILNRNPLSILATASGLHPFLRLLFSNYGERKCPNCQVAVTVLKEDEIIDKMKTLSKQHKFSIYAPLVVNTQGSHKTLLEMLHKFFDEKAVKINGKQWDKKPLDSGKNHTIELFVGEADNKSTTKEIRLLIQNIFSLGSFAVSVETKDFKLTMSKSAVCVICGDWLGDLKPLYFHSACPFCKGKGCEQCKSTGLHPKAVSVFWKNMNISSLLTKTVDELNDIFKQPELPESSERLVYEIVKRLKSLKQVGLGYLALNRSSPTLSRGESQRVKLSVAISSRLEDMLYVLDEPTIGQHMADVQNFLPIFGQLKGPVVFVEHDRAAASIADKAIDIGPKAGSEGGEVIFSGSVKELWESDTITGKYFSLKDRVPIPDRNEEPADFLAIEKATYRNLKGFDVNIPINRLTAITGVSGSGKSTFIEEVLVPSLKEKKPIGCEKITSTKLKPVIVDQNPIGRNPRSNPATYTKLSDIIRDIFASLSTLSATNFSFNTKEGACSECNGTGAKEVRMRYLPSSWIRCSACNGERFSDEVKTTKVALNDHLLSIVDFYKLRTTDAYDLIEKSMNIIESKKKAALRILRAMLEVGLGYLPLGQPSTTLSGGEAQRVKLAKYLGRATLSNNLFILDEPSTGLHSYDITGLIVVFNRLIQSGGTIVVVEHNADVIRAADWVIDLGPSAGAKGGELIFSGTAENLEKSKKSITGKFLREEETIVPQQLKKSYLPSKDISIHGARIHNLRNVSVNFPKNTFTVVTGVSGSGKSSLVSDVLESEARRRFLETLTMYERQSTKEGPEVPVDSVSGLGVTMSIRPDRRSYNLRVTIGLATEIFYHLTVLFARVGKKNCMKCNSDMVRGDIWICTKCKAEEPIAKVRHFASTNFDAACKVCNGVGSLRKPCPEKLIIHPDKPLCSGAMHSPGFFPFGYLCKPYNGGYYFIQSLGERYGFDPATTPWNEMTEEAQQAFLFGCEEPLEGIYESRKGIKRSFKQKFNGYYGWIRDWDVGGTYTETENCPGCKGAKLRPQYLSVKINGYNIHELAEMQLTQLLESINQLETSDTEIEFVKSSKETIEKRLQFLQQVGLGYINLNRIYATLSAGEAQRIRLAGLLGSGLTSLTILLDEPTRGMHPSEVTSLISALRSLSEEGNTVIVVEHDPVVIRSADYLLDMGPGPGVAGGEVVAFGPTEQVLKTESITAKWLTGKKSIDYSSKRRAPKRWLEILGASAYNLKNENVRIPLGVLVGICGVSGSGKSTLFIDTLGRALVPSKHTTSVAYEPIEPGEHKEIKGEPQRTVILNQSSRGIRNPLGYLGLFKPIVNFYSELEAAIALGLDSKTLSKRCSVCLGVGVIRTDMGFLPTIRTHCETCRGSGHLTEVWEVKYKGYSIPDLYGLTIDELYKLFKNEEAITKKLAIVKDVGLGYLVLRQPGYSLSGGETQRLKIAKELSKKTKDKTLYILDEPSVGQHLEDIKRLIEVLNKLVEDGHTVWVIEHSSEILAACDWLIELGPVGGPDGGKIIANGTPEDIAKGKTPSAIYIKNVLEGKL